MLFKLVDGKVQFVELLWINLERRESALQSDPWLDFPTGCPGDAVARRCSPWLLSDAPRLRSEHGWLQTDLVQQRLGEEPDTPL